MLTPDLMLALAAELTDAQADDDAQSLAAIAWQLYRQVGEHLAEIGLRRALGATKGQIRAQFFTEALLLSLLGGTAGITLGALATAIYAATKHWVVVVPLVAVAGGLGAALAVGAIAGLLPAIRAASLSPTEALRTT